MFRHIYSNDICLYNNTINYCLNSSKDIIDNFIEKNKNIHLINNFDNIIFNI
jgi:hypothetical protein